MSGDTTITTSPENSLGVTPGGGLDPFSGDVALGDAPAPDSNVPDETDIPGLENPNDPSKPLGPLHNRLVIGVSTKGSALVEMVDEVLEEAIEAMLAQVPWSGSRQDREVRTERIVGKVKDSPGYKEIRQNLLSGSADFDVELNKFKEAFGGNVSLPHLDGGELFDFADLIGFEAWFPPLQPDAIDALTDGDASFEDRLAGYLSNSLGNGFVNVKVFTDELKLLPGLGTSEQIATATTILTYAASAFGGAQAGVDVGELFKQFAGTGGTLFSGATERGNTFQVGFPINAWERNEDGIGGTVTEWWFTMLNYNVPILAGDPNQPNNQNGSPFYLGYSDLRRSVIKQNPATGEWDFAGFVIADRAIELGYNFSPSAANTSAGFNVHVGTIGKFSVYLDAEAIADGRVVQDENGTLGYYLEQDGEQFFKPFTEQELTLFQNVYLADGSGDISLDEVRTIDGEYTEVTDQTIAEADELGPTAKWVVDKLSDPTVQDLWTVGVTTIPALLTGNPVAIGEALINSYTDINQNQFNRHYDATVTAYTSNAGENEGQFVAEAFVLGELLGAGQDLEQIQENFQAFKETDAYNGQSLSEFINYGRNTTAGSNDNEGGQLAIESLNLVVDMEVRAEVAQGVITKLIEDGHASAEEIYGALAPYANGTELPPDGLLHLVPSFAERLLGGNDPIVLFDDTEQRIATNDYDDFRANIFDISIDTSRPAALKILHDTDGLTNLEDFNLSDLNDIETVSSQTYIVNELIEEQGIDPFQIYNALSPFHSDAWLGELSSNVPSLVVPKTIDDALRETIGDTFTLEDLQGLRDDDVISLLFRYYKPTVEGGQATSANLEHALSSFEDLLTGDLEEGQENLFARVPENGQEIFDTFIDTLAIDLVQQGAGGVSTGVEMLDARVAVYDGLVKGDLNLNQLTGGDAGLPPAIAERILEARADLKEDIDVQQYFDRDNNIIIDGGAVLDPAAYGDEFGDVTSEIANQLNVVASADATGLNGLLLNPNGVDEGDLHANSNAFVRDAVIDNLTAYSATVDGSTTQGFSRQLAVEANIRDFVDNIENWSPEDKQATLDALFVDPSSGNFILKPQSQLDPQVLAFRDRTEELSALTDEDGAPLYTEAEAQSIAYSEYSVSVLDGDPTDGLITNPAARDARYEASQLNLAEDTDGDGVVDTGGQTPLDQPAFDQVFDFEYDAFVSDANMLSNPDASAEAKADAASRMEARGATIGPDGSLVLGENGSLSSQAAAFAGDQATDPARNDLISALIASGADPADITAAVAATQNGATLPADGTSGGSQQVLLDNIDAEIARAQEQGNIPGVIALSTARMVILFTDDGARDADFFADVLSGGEAGVTALLTAIGKGDVAAYATLMGDLGDAIRLGSTDGTTDGFANVDGTVAAISALSFLGSTLRQRGEVNQNDTEFLIGTSLEVGGKILGESILGDTREITTTVDGVSVTEEIEVDVEQVITDLSVDASSAIFSYFGAKYDNDELQFVGAGIQGGYEVYSQFIDNNPETGSISDVIASTSATLGTLFDDETGATISSLGSVGAELYQVFFKKGATKFATFGNEGLKTFLASDFYQTANTAALAASVVIEILGLVGVDIPPEVQFAGEVAVGLASGPVGWVGLAVNIAMRIFGAKSFTEVRPYLENVDVDNDVQWDDNVSIATQMHSDFFGRVHVDDGEIRYEVNGVNPDLLQHATFDLRTEVGAELNVRNDSDEGMISSLTVDGVTYQGEITSSRGDINYRGYSVNSRNGGKVTSGTFESDDGSFSLPVIIGGHNDDDYGADFELAPEAADALPSRYFIDIEGRYGALNPVTDGEDFSETVEVSAEQFAQLQAELGSTAPVTLQGANPLLNAPTALSTVMDGLTIEFESDSRDPNVFRYADINRDGIQDLVRYGIQEDGDGLHSGDLKFEVWLLDAEGQPLGVTNVDGSAGATLPSFKVSSLEEAVEIGSLSDYLMQWAAARPDQWEKGLDLQSIYHAAEEAGDLDKLVEIRDLTNTAFSAGLENVLADVESGVSAVPTPEEEMQMVANGERVVALMGEVGLFNVNEYQASHPHLAGAYGGNAVELSYDYIINGNPAGAAITRGGLTMDVGAPPVLPEHTYKGVSLEPGEALYGDEMLLSANGDFATVFYQSGELHVYDISAGEKQLIWAADRDGGSSDGQLLMQADGNLVLYDEDGDVSWDTSTYARLDGAGTDYALVMQDDGNLVLMDLTDDRVLWSSMTGKLGEAGHPGGDFSDLESLEYIASYTDLMDAFGTNIDSAQQHYSTSGQGEGREITFSAADYLAANVDLQQAFGDDVGAAAHHYITTGRFEGRVLAPGAAPEALPDRHSFRDGNGNGEGEILLNGEWIEAEIDNMDHYRATGLGQVQLENTVYPIAREGGAP